MDAMPPEQVVGMARNGWTASIGIAGRHGPDYAVMGVWWLYGLWGAFKCWRGEEFRYAFIGKRILTE